MKIAPRPGGNGEGGTTGVGDGAASRNGVHGNGVGTVVENADLNGHGHDNGAVLGANGIGRGSGRADAPALDAAIDLGQAVIGNLGRILFGAKETLTAAAVAVLSGGHLLIEDVPGVGKTVLARALATSLGAELSRVQGHPDLLPSDVTGVSVFSPDNGSWEFRQGPVFAHVVLFDELNRTPPRTQSALLETMEEHQVSMDGESWSLPRPHMVIATQNPRSQRGTFPLVESQLDRFAIATSVGYPDAANEALIALHQGGHYALANLKAVCDPPAWLAAQQATELVSVTLAVAEYAVEICRASRTAPGVRLGASPRAAIWLIRAAQAHAILSARTYVVPADVKTVAVACLAHRILLDDGEESIQQAAQVIERLLEATPSPRP